MQAALLTKSASLFLQQKNLIFCWRKNEARWHPPWQWAPQYFFRKKCLFFPEEIMRRAGRSPDDQSPTITSEEDQALISGPADVMRHAGRPMNTERLIIPSRKKPGASLFLQKKCLFFYEKKDQARRLLSWKPMPLYFFRSRQEPHNLVRRNNADFFLKK